MKKSSYKEEMGKNLIYLRDKAGISESDYLLRNTRELTLYISQQFEGIPYSKSDTLPHNFTLSGFTSFTNFS